MEPQIIQMIVEPQDVLGEIIRRRSAQLEAKHPEFRAEFAFYERKIKEHADHLKPNMNDQLFDRVIQELELKEHNLKHVVHATPVLKIHPGRVDSPGKVGSSGRMDNLGRSSESHPSSNRNSELSELGFRPYKLSNFSRELHHLKLKLNE